jgi:hypothetical protein
MRALSRYVSARVTLSLRMGKVFVSAISAAQSPCLWHLQEATDAILPRFSVREAFEISRLSTSLRCGVDMAYLITVADLAEPQNIPRRKPRLSE